MFRTRVRQSHAWRLVCALSLLTLTGSLHAQESESLLVERQAETPDEIAAVLDYWTDDAMVKAQPLIEEVEEGTPAPIAKFGDASIEVRLPSGGGTSGTVDPKLDGADLPVEASPDFGTFPFSFTRYRLFPDINLVYTTFPYSTIGKLFFTIPGRGNYVCSASSVNSNNRSVVWTAGHCVFTRGVGWHTNFVFVPARRSFANPFGLWTARQAWTLVGWTNGFFEYDMGALVMNRGGTANLHIGNAVGWLGFLANAARQQHWHLHGYPAAPRNLPTTPPGPQFDGEHHELCAATWSTNDMGWNGPQTIGVGCDKTGGTSGGPWTVDFNSVGGFTNMLNGNNSYRYGGGPPNSLRLYGPYFTTGAINLRNAAQAVFVP